MGCYYTAHTLLPGMISRGTGHLCFVSSMVYANPMAGYSGYAPTKAAVRHLADCLRSELSGTGVTVSLGYPPDTQTPGFDVENQTKAGVTHAIMEHENESVHTPESVAVCMMRGLRRGAYHLPTPSLFHSLGLSLVAGITPRPRWILLEVLLAPLLVIVSWITYVQQDAVVRKWRAAQALKARPPAACTMPSTPSPPPRPFQPPLQTVGDVPAVSRASVGAQGLPSTAGDTRAARSVRCVPVSEVCCVLCHSCAPAIPCKQYGS